MKQYSAILFLSFMILSLDALSQEIKISEMEKMLLMSPPKRENFILEKGYSFQFEKDGTKIYIYGSKQNFSRSFYINGNLLGFMTSNTSEYTRNVDEAEKLNFIYQSGKGGKSGFNYKKSNLKLTFSPSDELNTFHSTWLGTEDEFKRFFSK